MQGAGNVGLFELVCAVHLSIYILPFYYYIKAYITDQSSLKASKILSLHCDELSTWICVLVHQYWLVGAFYLSGCKFPSRTIKSACDVKSVISGRHHARFGYHRFKINIIYKTSMCLISRTGIVKLPKWHPSRSPWITQNFVKSICEIIV